VIDYKIKFGSQRQGVKPMTAVNSTAAAAESTTEWSNRAWIGLLAPQ